MKEMVKLRIKIGEAELEFEGDIMEVDALSQPTINKILKLGPYPIQTQLAIETKPIVGKQTVSLSERLPFKLPSYQEIKEYILSRPNYEHTLHDVHMQLCGRPLVSHGETKSMYHAVAHQARRARKEIEMEQKGTFHEVVLDTKHNVKQYIFKKDAIQTMTAVQRYS